MRLIRVGAAVLNQTPLDWEGNRRRILDAIEQARKQKVSLLCLPELCITGYGCEDAFYSTSLQAKAFEMVKSIAPHTKGVAVSVGMPLLHQNGLFNVVGLIADGAICGFVAKRFLAGDGIHYEPRWFKGWPRGRAAEVTLDGVDYPLGDYYFDFKGVKVGFEICEDAWVANRPGVELSLRGVDIILNPSASHFAFGKFDVRKRFVLEGSRAFGVSYVYANLVGNESGRAIYDGGAMVASKGALVAVGHRFTFKDVEVTSAVVDIDGTRTVQSRTGSFEPDLQEATGHHRVEVGFDFPKETPGAAVTSEPDWESGSFVKEEEFTRAIALGLFDYLRKSHSSGFVVSLSGGADSAAATCLVALMVALGWKEIGRDGLLAKLPEASLQKTKTAKEIVRQILVCVYQATENSSDVTRTAAREVANGVGAEFLEFSVSQLVHDYVGMVEKSIGRKLDWKHDDTALQNIQARVRSPGVWLLANLRNALLLTTSNRSEAAVGYATMDGDTSGGLSPLGGIDKAFLRRWLNWLETTGPAGIFSVPALSHVNQQAPTAELRPLATKQTDEADLMPYEVLDPIERSFIRDKRSPLEVFQLMNAQFPQYGTKVMAGWVERFFKLWCRNQWKRERYAPSFHLDDENLDPKTWCRFPILSGGYELELRELRAYVADLEKAKS